MQTTNATPQIFLNGRIISANNFEADELFIKYEMIYGTNFKVVEGETRGETFQAVPHMDQPIIYFDHPLSVNFSCRSIKGWPKFLIEVWANDYHNRNYLIGYGTCFVPFKSGTNVITIKCWRPREKIGMNLSEFFIGNTPEFIDKSAVYSNEEKFGFFSLSTGSVTIELDVIMKDFNLHGIKVGK
jgi:B9 domain-containing protein 2